MWAPSTVTNESILRMYVPAKISCHVPEKNMAEAVTRDMASSDWLKLAALCFARKVYRKINPICDCAGARHQHSYLYLVGLFNPSSQVDSWGGSPSTSKIVWRYSKILSLAAADTGNGN